jgi:hypothetical protein
LKLFFERILISDDLIEDRLSSSGVDESVGAQRLVDEPPAQDWQEPR